ncbi:CamS family sex pheromone protein [Erysipelothrix urinaevulpis]|uniref:CamS family sex pheromone protein n=1 Tax=Erysipelothrix urinaevulpis TaxID=2683717 RepID=UPI001359EEA8|nr:CamS family sex pheromone protein [Erysipelothrix urinaevulpis]
MKNKITLLLALMLLLSACGSKKKEEPVEEDKPVSIVDSNKGDYSILVPFINSPLRQSYASNFREIDMMEIGSGLQERSKEFFDPDKYSVSEGSLIDRDRYNNLLGNQSDKNPNGLNLKPFEIKDGSVTLKDPTFVSDIVEINFHRSNKVDEVDGIAVALVLKRVQILDHKIGSTHKLSDETLFEVGRTLGLRLYSYLSSLEGMGDVPIYIGLYAQESDIDKLPGKYLPGNYIGHAFFKTRSDQFVKDNEQWILLNDKIARDKIPDAASSFSRLRKNIHTFAGDENIGVVASGFLVDDRLQKINIEVVTGSKTYLEIYALSQYINKELAMFDAYQVPVKVDIRIYQKSRVVIERSPGKDSKIIELN